jgi:uracil-DNA glycosylase family 4
MAREESLHLHVACGPVGAMSFADLMLLRLQIEWGADEALAETPLDRLGGRQPPAGAAGPLPAASPARFLPSPPPRIEAPPPRPAGIAARAAELAAAAQTREQLRAALAAFEDCPLSATATNLVFADGNPDAGLMFIGEAPGAEEDRAGLPFVGPSGQFLDRMLASIGLDRRRFLITNLIPWRPPGNRNPTDAEVLLCLPFLQRHIALVRPRHLVLLGSLATKALTGSTAGIRRLRGRWLDLEIPGLADPVPTLPMFHPAYLLRTAGAKREAWADLIALRRRLDADLTA